MTRTSPQTKTDPLAAWVAGAAIAATKRPIPLIATRFDVAIAGGLAEVATRRTFRNDEGESIEATLTFPVPVHATLFALEARIAGRLLTARAEARKQARETYESALDRGKSAVLHEEVLRGVHMLSVGHIPPGAEVAVSARWAMSLTQVEGSSRLRIPLTVGDVYGRSGLPDSDELAHGGPAATAALSVTCRDGSATLIGGRLVEGHATVPLDAPIDLEITGWTSQALPGRAADGREVVLRVAPSPGGEAPLDIAVVIDRSGSMGEICVADGKRLTKHDAIRGGLEQIARRLGAADVVDLWEFDDAPGHVGRTGPEGERLLRLIGKLGSPRGGTEIGRAIGTVLTESAARDLLLVTDGKSHALDVQAIAGSGRRFSVVLVGEDSLEANVGHLAALTAGEIFVAAGSDLADSLAAAVASLRTAPAPIAKITGALRQVSARRAGMTLTAEWREADEAIAVGGDGRAVAAFCAGLALPALDAEAATQLAVAEGLVTHLTSLVLVDEAGASQEGIPASRKIALPTPRTAMAMALPPPPAAFADSPGPFARARSSAAPGAAPTENDAAEFIPRPGAASAPRVLPGLAELAGEIDWDAAPQRLQRGDLSAVEPGVASEIRRAAADPEVLAVARKLRLSPVALIVALLARAHAIASRSAARIARAVLGQRLSLALRRIAGRMGLEVDDTPLE